MNDPSGVSIGKAASRVGLSVHAVRYYESAGLIPAVPRTASGRRVFTNESLAWLEYAACLRALGMPVAEVAEYVRAASSGAPNAQARAQMRRHLDAMKRRRDELGEYIELVGAKLDAMERDR